MQHLWNDKVTVVRRSQFDGPVNDMGQKTRGNTRIAARGFFTYGKGEHTTEISFDGVATFYCPVSTLIDDYDLVLFGGEEWVVSGPPQTHRSAFAGPRFLAVPLERSEGK